MRCINCEQELEYLGEQINCPGCNEALVYNPKAYYYDGKPIRTKEGTIKYHIIGCYVMKDWKK